MSCDVEEVTESLENELSSFSKLSVTFTYVTAHSPTLPSLYLRHSSFSDPSVASPKSQIILQPFRRFIYVTGYSPTFPLLHLLHRSFSNPSVALSTSQLFSDPPVTLPTLHLILQLFFRRSSTANSGIKVAVLLGINRCGSFPLLSAPLSL